MFIKNKKLLDTGVRFSTIDLTNVSVKDVNRHQTNKVSFRLFVHIKKYWDEGELWEREPKYTNMFRKVNIVNLNQLKS